MRPVKFAGCAAFFSGKIGHSERSEESRPRHEENEILRCAQNDGIAYLPENMAAGCKLHFAYCLSGGLVVALAGGLGLAILPKGG